MSYLMFGAMAFHMAGSIKPNSLAITFEKGNKYDTPY